MTDDMNELIAAVGPGDAGRLVGMEDAVWVRIGERRERARMGQVRVAAVALALVIGVANGGLMLMAPRPAQDDALKDSPSARAVQDRHAAWAGDIPKDDAALWDWLADLDEPSRMALLAHCVSYGVNALYERPNPHSGSGVSQHTLDMRLSQADRLTKATGLDLVEAGWRPGQATATGTGPSARQGWRGTSGS